MRSCRRHAVRPFHFPTLDAPLACFSLRPQGTRASIVVDDLFSTFDKTGRGASPVKVWPGRGRDARYWGAGWLPS